MMPPGSPPWMPRRSTLHREIREEQVMIDDDDVAFLRLLVHAR